MNVKYLSFSIVIDETKVVEDIYIDWSVCSVVGGDFTYQFIDLEGMDKDNIKNTEFYLNSDSFTNILVQMVIFNHLKIPSVVILCFNICVGCQKTNEFNIFGDKICNHSEMF